MAINIEEIRKVMGSLIDQPRWACYQAIWDENRKKYSKVPVNPHSGGGAKSNDARTWGSLKQALHYMDANNNIAGVVIALSPDDDLVGIDIDDCWDVSAQRWNLIAAEIIQAADSYTEISPSGRGIRILLRGALPLGRRKNSKNGVEMYDSGRFLTITGNHVENTAEEICRRDEEINAIHSTYLGTQKESTSKDLAEKRPRSTMIDDEDILELAFNSANGERFQSLYEGDWEDDYGSQSEADLSLCCMLAFWTGWHPEQMERLFCLSELYRDKWDKRHYGDGKTYGQGVIQKAIEVTEKCYLQDDEWEDLYNE